MRLELHEVAVGTGPGAALPPVSVAASRLRPGVVGVETLDAPVLASLVAGGRLRPDRGTVTLDGHVDDAGVRAAVALVDTPGVAEPFPALRLEQVVREELALAGVRASRGTVADFLDAAGLTGHARTRLEALPTVERVRALTELALLRPGVHGLVVTSPERHGGDVAAWAGVLAGLVERGVTVLVVTSVAAADVVRAHLPVVDDAPAPTTAEAASTDPAAADPDAARPTATDPTPAAAPPAASRDGSPTDALPAPTPADAGARPAGDPS